MNILVTGGSGFLGRHLISHLLNDGHSIRVLDVSDASWKDPRVEFIASSFSDGSVMNSAVAGSEIVFHLASSVIPKTSNDDPTLDATSNLVGTLRLLDSCVKAGVHRFIFASSGGTVYGEPQTTAVAEHCPTEPICSYGIVKLAIEKYLALYHRLHGLESASLRISNLYGEHQRPDTGLGVIAAFCHNATHGKQIEIWGDGTVSRDFVYVGDVVDAMYAAMDRGGPCLVANIGSGESVSLNEIIDIIEHALGREIKKSRLPGRTFDVQRTCLDIERARSLLDWTPRTKLCDGIKRVLLSAQAMNGQV